MAQDIVVGIDIGTHTTRVMIAEHGDNEHTPRILGTGKTESAGLRHGYVVNREDVARSLRSAIKKAEQSAGIRAKRAYVAIGGISLASHTVTTSVIISKGDGEITNLDLEQLHDKSEEAIHAAAKNRKIIHMVPLKYLLDGKEILGRPVGLHGVKLEMRTLFITCLEHHFEDLVSAVEGAGIKIIDVVAAPIATSMAVLTKKQKTVGCLLVDIGAETVSMAVFENDSIVSLEIFPIGSMDITNDIALGFRIPLEEAEKIKTGAFESNVPRKKLEEIVSARLSDIFELIENHLKKIKRNRLLPAGAIITGGGGTLSTIEEFAKASLELPSRMIRVEHINNVTAKKKIADPSWLAAYGLCFLGGESQSDDEPALPFAESLRDLKRRFKGFIEQLMP